MKMDDKPWFKGRLWQREILFDKSKMLELWGFYQIIIRRHYLLFSFLIIIIIVLIICRIYRFRTHHHACFCDSHFISSLHLHLLRLLTALCLLSSFRPIPVNTESQHLCCLEMAAPNLALLARSLALDCHSLLAPAPFKFHVLAS